MNALEQQLESLVANAGWTSANHLLNRLAEDVDKDLITQHLQRLVAQRRLVQRHGPIGLEYAAPGHAPEYSPPARHCPSLGAPPFARAALSPEALDAAAQVILDALADGIPRTARELQALTELTASTFNLAAAQLQRQSRLNTFGRGRATRYRRLPATLPVEPPPAVASPARRRTADIRAAITTLLQADPRPHSFGRLAAAAGIRTSVLIHHLRALRHSGHVTQPSRGHWQWRPAPATDPGEGSTTEDPGQTPPSHHNGTPTGVWFGLTSDGNLFLGRRTPSTEGITLDLGEVTDLLDYLHDVAPRLQRLQQQGGAACS